MNICLILTLLFSFLGFTKPNKINHKKEETKNEFDLDMLFQSYGVSVDSEEVEATYFGQIVGFQMSYMFLDPSKTENLEAHQQSLELFLNAGLGFETGSHVAQFSDVFIPSNFVFLREGVFKWNPIKQLKLNAGAVSQRFLNLPILVNAGTAFAGTQQFVEFNLSKNIDLKLMFTQSIPNNHVLAQRITNVSEGTPYFYSESFQFDFKKFNNFSARIMGGQYRFQNLSTAVANQSRFLGNSVTGTTNIDSSFIYDFKGYFGSISVTYQHDNFKFTPGYSHLFNDAAPDNRNNGYHGFLEVRYMTSTLDIAPNLFVYRNESDTSPAFYNSKWLGNNNRVGTGLKVLCDFKKQKFQLEFSALQNKPIEQNLFQNEQDIYLISITKPFSILERSDT